MKDNNTPAGLLNERARLILQDCLPKSPTGKWIMALICGLAVSVMALNVWVGWLYFAQNKSLEYFDSKTFEALLASLVIPLLMWSISSAFKIGEKMEAEKDRLEREKKEKQYQAIRETATMWSTLYKFSTEIAYFKKDASAKASMDDHLKKLEIFANSAGEVVSLWCRNFPAKSRADSAAFISDINLFVDGMNVLLQAVATVADAIAANDREAEELQNGLLIVQDGVRCALHQRILFFFHSKMEGRDEDASGQIAALRDWLTPIHTFLNKQGPNLPDGAPAQNFYAKRAELQTACKLYSESPKDESGKHPQDPLDDSSELHKEYSKSVDLIPMSQLGFSRRRPFSTPQIKYLAAYMVRKDDLDSIRKSV